MTHYIVGFMPEEKTAEEGKKALLYSSWLFKDIKTIRGALARGRRYAKTNGGYYKNMIPVMLQYSCSVTDGTTPADAIFFLD